MTSAQQPADTPTLGRRLVSELVGTGLLVTVVVGSGIAAARLSPDDIALQQLENAIATAFALGVLILVSGPVSGAHFNPVVTLVDWWFRRHDHGRPPAIEVGGYITAQVTGGIAGAVLANLMYALTAVSSSTTTRTGPNLWLGEVVATAGLVLVIFALARNGRSGATPAAVGAYIGAAYWFTSSTSFANPAVSLGRAFTDTFSGMAPASLPGFLTAQLLGAIAGAGHSLPCCISRHQLAMAGLLTQPPPSHQHQRTRVGVRPRSSAQSPANLFEYVAVG